MMFVIPAYLSAEDPGAAPETEMQEEQNTNYIQEEQNTNYIYEPKGRRDPFIPLVELQKQAIKKSPRALGTLEGYDISDFTLIAVVVKRHRQNYALVLTTDNKSFTIRKGTVLGLNSGKVKEIKSDKVLIEEYIKDYIGELKPRQVVLELRKQGGK